MIKKVALYLRVSTASQTVENQDRELQSVVERNGWTVVQIFTDAGISGAKGRDMRPGLDALLKGVARRQFDVVAAWSVDRLGRSLADLVALLQELHDKHIDLYLHQQGIDTTTHAGRAMFQMMGVFAEFERAMIQDRVRAGLARARAEGVTLGRPKVGLKVEARIKEALSAGAGIRRVARELGVGTSTVQRIANEVRT
jgi:DNA invertase Pin-like site-specific DNA recombinase